MGCPWEYLGFRVLLGAVKECHLKYENKKYFKSGHLLSFVNTKIKLSLTSRLCPWRYLGTFFGF